MTNTEHIYLQFLVGFAVLLFSLMLFALWRSQVQRRGQKKPLSLSQEEFRQTSQNPQSSSNAPTNTTMPEQLAEVSPVSLNQALQKTEGAIWGRLRSWFDRNPERQGAWDELEEILYTSDLGPKTVQRLIAKLERELPAKASLQDLQALVKSELLASMSKASIASTASTTRPEIWMIVGVNGAGKTTTIGKLAARAAVDGRKILVAAGDTFRAAAGSQLKTWTERAQVEIFSPENVKDPSAVAFAALEKAKSAGFDLLIVDTAGRLTTAKPLMDELAKMKRVINPSEVLLVLDASSGQNALHQAREFHQALGVTGVILTKLDGTSKGGVAVALAEELGLSIRYVGLGEKIGDIQEFSPDAFVKGLIAEV